MWYPPDHRFSVYAQILENFSTDNATKLNGIIEADETFFLEPFKGQKDLPRPAWERGGKAAQPETSAEQIPVLIARDRSGGIFDVVLNGLDKQCVGDALKPVLGEDALLCTDGSSAFKAMAKDADIPHQPVNIQTGIRVIDQAFHSQNVNDSRLKEWMRCLHGVSTRDLDTYLGWPDSLSVNLNMLETRRPGRLRPSPHCRGDNART